MPYLALAKTLEAIEETSGRLKIVEILANFLRSVIVLSPDDFLFCVYLCLNKVAPAFEGLELRIGDTILIRAIAQASGRSPEKIKADAERLGDLGIVAEQSRTNQRVMFQPAKLTVAGVFKKLKEIALMTGHAVSGGGGGFVNFVCVLGGFLPEGDYTYCYFHANCSIDLANCMPSLLLWPRCTRLSSSSHPYSVQPSNTRVNHYS
ncbi:DNA ligase 1 [Portunus trituberculatus]|uniref:DNA ligase 1 n=1 Tax=Portunus trituberculatus TaxID=210409 RepID=A0A5B7HUT1_PORTR|nr:DNA ligase 1 [Portunus trituberculatus]